MREFQLAASLRDEGDVPGALEHLRRSLELDPDNPRAHLLMGYIRIQRHEYAEAEVVLRRGVALLAEEPNMGRALAEARNVLGVALIHQGRAEEALELLRESATDALNTAPWYAYGNLGWAHFELADYPASVEALERAVEIQPRFCLGYFLLGKTLFATEEHEAAEEALTGALEADPRCGETYQDAYRLRGEVRALLGARDDAIGDLERCVELGARSEAGRMCGRLLDEVQP